VRSLAEMKKKLEKGRVPQVPAKAGWQPIVATLGKKKGKARKKEKVLSYDYE